MGGILFVSSLNTGHGHRSITEALQEQLSRIAPSVQVDEVDGFMLGGKFSGLMSKTYNKIVVSVPLFWKAYYELGNIFPSVANHFVSKSMKKDFVKLINTNRPDLIVSVHPCYVSSVEDILEQMGWKIPVVALIADLDNVARMWADKRSLYTLCPTINAKNSMLKFGISEEKIKLFGFPVRDRFNHFEPAEGITYYEHISGKKRLTFLIMNGSQGLRLVVKMAKELLDSFNCNVVILAGNNGKLKKTTEKALQSYGDKVTVCGFVKNVEQYMSQSDIMILRASPNVIMEAVNLCKPVIITGALTGQEEKNPEFAVNNKLGVVCKDIHKLPRAIKQLLASEGKNINNIYENQIKYRQPQAAEEIAEFLLIVLRENSRGGSNENY